jgi:hypothetical protein
MSLRVRTPILRVKEKQLNDNMPFRLVKYQTPPPLNTPLWRPQKNFHAPPWVETLAPPLGNGSRRIEVSTDAQRQLMHINVLGLQPRNCLIESAVCTYIPHELI